MSNNQPINPPSPAGTPSRRALLRFGVVGAGAALVTVACGGGAKKVAETITANPTVTVGTTPGSTAVATATATSSPAASSGAASAQALVAVQSFLSTLDATQKTSVLADRTQANLSKWSNLPDGAFQRAGIRMDTLSADQQKAALAILAVVLSPEGYTQVEQITTADGVLAQSSGGGGAQFGADHYYIRFVGEPSATTPWTLQYGGHHLAVNVSLAGSKMTMAPTLWGSQPAFYALNGKDIEPLGGETRKAWALMSALDGSQQSAAVVANTRDLVLGAGQDGKTVAAAGVSASTFTNAQKQLLLELVQEWLRPLNAESVASRMETAEGELDQITFAWNGTVAEGQQMYYRVQSPTAVIEFAHQSMGGDAVNHIHSIYREIGNDYGASFS
ncbi:MAG: DUF3500 domain-containing protein [Dehalococcoidia bacterium]